MYAVKYFEVHVKFVGFKRGILYTYMDNFNVRIQSGFQRGANFWRGIVKK